MKIRIVLLFFFKIFSVFKYSNSNILDNDLPSGNRNSLDEWEKVLNNPNNDENLYRESKVKQEIKDLLKREQNKLKINYDGFITSQNKSDNEKSSSEIDNSLDIKSILDNERTLSQKSNNKDPNLRFKETNILNNHENIHDQNDQPTETLQNIILETLKNNPNNVKGYLPTLVKIITKNGLLCDFPFVYNDEEYHDRCVLFTDNKFYCKINSENPQNFASSLKLIENIERNNRIENYIKNLFDDKSKLRIQKSKEGVFYFDECLSIDETQRYFNDIIEENYDFKHKILLDLYSDIKIAISETKQEKLNLLYQLMDNYCKNKNFDFDCIYDNLILPISKNKDLNILSDKILTIFKKYESKLKSILNKSIQERFKLEEYEFIKEENFKLSSQSDREESSYSSIFEDDDQSTISLNLINTKSSTSKISIKNFFKILASIYNICIEECKIVIDYLFVDNFEKDFDRIKLEIMAYLFKLKNFSNGSFSKDNSNKNYFDAFEKKINNEDYFSEPSNKKHGNEKKYDDYASFDQSFFDVEKNIYGKIFKNVTHVNFLGEVYPLYSEKIYNNITKQYQYNKGHLVDFLEYKKWSVRFTIHLIYRYLIVEKSFFRDYILNHMTDIKLDKILRSPEQLTDKNQLIRLVKSVPLISPYYSFSSKMHLDQFKIYDIWNNITNSYLEPLRMANETIAKYKSIISFIVSDIQDRLDVIENYFSQDAKRRLMKKKNLFEFTQKKVQSTKTEKSIEKKIKLQSYLNNLDYLINNIYKINYFSQDCHKFIHYNTYFGNYTFGRPINHYIGIEYDPYFFIEFENDIQIYFVYAFLKTNTRIPINYTITITTNSIIDLYLDDVKIFPDTVSNIYGENYYDCLVKYNFTYVSESVENAHVEVKIKGNFMQGTNLIDKTDFYYSCPKMNSKDLNKFLDFNITRKHGFEKYTNVKLFPPVNLEKQTTQNNFFNYNKNDDLELLKLYKNSFAMNKCMEHQSELSLCFNYNAYFVDCQIATKYLSEKYKNDLQNKLYILDTEKSLNNKIFKYERDEYNEYLRTHKKADSVSVHDQKDNNKQSANPMKNKKNTEEKDQDSISDLFQNKQFIKDMGLIFMRKSEKFCNSLKWDIFTYKCILRNIGTSEFDTVLLKCGAFKLWEMVGRNNNLNWNTDNNHKVKLNKVLLGRQFYMENSNLKINFQFLPYIQPSIIRPLSNINYFLKFNFTQIDEFLFTSGDMEYFSSYKKEELFIKGYPYNSIGTYSHKLISSMNKDKPYIYQSSIFNPLFPDANFDDEGVVIFGNKFYGLLNDLFNNTKDNSNPMFCNSLNKENSDAKQKCFSSNNYNEKINFVFFSFNKKFSQTNNEVIKYVSEKILRDNRGANIFVRQSNVCLEKNFFYSNLSTKSFYIEKVIAMKFIFSYFKSNFLLYRLPKFLDKNSILLRSSHYQSSYNINLTQKTRIYFAIEINDFIEINAPFLVNDDWKFISGNDNIIEVLTSDAAEDIIERKGDFKFYYCILNSHMNPKCKGELHKDLSFMKYSIFYKDFKKGNQKISYNFMDFDSLYGSMHLIFLSPLECLKENHNLNSFNDNVDNHVVFNYEYLPTFNPNITDFKNIVTSIDYELIKKKLLIKNNKNDANHQNHNSKYSLKGESKLFIPAQVSMNNRDHIQGNKNASFSHFNHTIKRNFTNDKKEEKKKLNKPKERLILDCDEKTKSKKYLNKSSLDRNLVSEKIEKSIDSYDHTNEINSIKNNYASDELISIENTKENEILSLSFLEFILREMKSSGLLDDYLGHEKSIEAQSQKTVEKENSEIDVLSEIYYRRLNFTNYHKSSSEKKGNNKSLQILNNSQEKNLSTHLTYNLGDIKLKLNSKSQRDVWKFLKLKFNISRKNNIKSLKSLDIPIEKQVLLVHYLDKNYTAPKIRANSGGCLFALDRLGNLYLKKIGKSITNANTSVDSNSDLEEDDTEIEEEGEELRLSERKIILNYNKNKTEKINVNMTNKKKDSKNKNKSNYKEEKEYTYNEYKWSLIKSNVKYFDLSENVLLTMDFKQNFQFQTGISQQNECFVRKNKWKNLNLNISSNIIRFSLSSFDCLWLYDNNNFLHFIDKFNFFEYKYKKINSSVLDHFSGRKIKNIYQYMDKLYILTRDNKIHIKKSVFNFERSECEIGNVLTR